MTKDEALKHHSEKYGISLKQFKTMCNNASKHYENQGMNSVDYGLAREAYFAGFTDACKEALEQPAQDYVLICKRCGDDLGIEYVPDEQPAFDYNTAFSHGYEAHRVEQAAQEPVAHIKQGMDGYPKLVFNGTFQYDSIAAKQPDIALYIKEQL